MSDDRQLFQLDEVVTAIRRSGACAIVHVPTHQEVEQNWGHSQFPLPANKCECPQFRSVPNSVRRLTCRNAAWRVTIRGLLLVGEFGTTILTGVHVLRKSSKHSYVAELWLA
jgi:hypothetical protein